MGHSFFILFCRKLLWRFRSDGEECVFSPQADRGGLPLLLHLVPFLLVNGNGATARDRKRFASILFPQPGRCRLMVVDGSEKALRLCQYAEISGSLLVTLMRLSMRRQDVLMNGRWL